MAGNTRDNRLYADNRIARVRPYTRAVTRFCPNKNAVSERSYKIQPCRHPLTAVTGKPETYGYWRCACSPARFRTAGLGRRRRFPTGKYLYTLISRPPADGVRRPTPSSTRTARIIIIIISRTDRSYRVIILLR